VSWIATLYTRAGMGGQESEQHQCTGRVGVERWTGSGEIGNLPFEAGPPLGAGSPPRDDTHSRVGMTNGLRANLRFCFHVVARAPDDGYYGIDKRVCIDRRSSRLLWGSGNARQNRVPQRWEVGAGFRNRVTGIVRTLENRWRVPRGCPDFPARSTGGDAIREGTGRWTRGNCGPVQEWSGFAVCRISTGGSCGPGFPADPQEGCGWWKAGPNRVRFRGSNRVGSGLDLGF
jgi:hypothetical protein